MNAPAIINESVRSVEREISIFRLQLSGVQAATVTTALADTLCRAIMDAHDKVRAAQHLLAETRDSVHYGSSLASGPSSVGEDFG